MGVAGSGKSTQGRMLADNLALPWVSTGEFLRMLTSGDKRKAMLAGRLMSDEEIIDIAQKIFTIVDTEEEFILDGFPRTTGQADWMLSQTKYGQLDITAVIHLEASKEAVTDRLLNRGRQDDTKEAIEERFNEYEAQTKPILEQYAAININVVSVNAEQNIEDIHSDIKTKVSEILYAN